MSELEPPLPRKERRARQRTLPLPEVKFVPAGNPSLPTFVSLMLMITTFMIVLTSISLHENSRMHELLSGVKQTFALGQAATPTKSVGEILGSAATGFQASLPMVKVAGASGGESLRLIIPIGVALDTTQKQATPEMEKALATLVTGLSELPKDTGYEIELRFADESMSADYAGILAQAAMNRGLAPARTIIGNGTPNDRAGKPDELALLVRLTLPATDFVQKLPDQTEAP
ncbi:MAG: hypothetical protein HYU58_15770 [Proteobacteria bacterium]|nr:hypothetical protein [Pseudomonadota bacterium]